MSVLRFILPALAAITMSVPMAQAQQAPKAEAPAVMLTMMTASHPEHVLLAFEKTAGLQPNFQTWAALSPYLEKANDADVPAIINRESNRLSRAYAEFDLSQPLVVHTTVHLDNYSTINGVLHLNEFTTATFFTYTIYGENVAIVPKDIASFGTLSIPKARMDEMLGKARGSNVTAELLLKPTVADAKTPFEYNHKDYSLLLAEIAEIRLWAPGITPQLVWNYRADWYQPKIDQTLMNLKPDGGQ